MDNFRKMYMKLFKVIVAAFIILYFTAYITGISVKADVKSSNVLILNSYHRGHEWTDKQGEAIIKKLDESGINYNVYSEYMDWKRYPTEENLKQLYERFKYKYFDMKIDIIMTTDDGALSFALKNRKDLFSNSPIIFSGVLKKSADILLKDSRNVTGAYEGMDPEETLKAALNMLPGIKNVYVIHDKSESGIATGNIIKDTTYYKENKLNFIELSNDSFDEILEKAALLKNDSIVIMASYNYDINNLSISNKKFAQAVTSHSAVPVFTIDEALLGTGCMGGSLTSGNIHGTTASEIAIEVLKGKAADAIPIVNKKPVYFGFDYNALKKFSIPIDKLPENSMIINKPFSFYESYKAMVHSTIAGVTFLVIIITILTIHISFKKKTEVRLKDSNLELVDLYKKVTASEKELKRQQIDIYKLAYYNSVTGLPNKIMLRERIDNLLTADSNLSRFAFIYMDLDNFKDINDSYGHTTGDKILYEIGQRLKQLEEEYIRVFNLGGDEFVILIERLNSNAYIESVVKEILYNIFLNMKIDGNIFNITASAGVAMFPDVGRSYTELLRSADTAMYKAKEKNKGSYTFYDKVMGDAAVEKIKMQNSLSNAMEKDEFVLFYQPQLKLKDGKISGFEALIRWKSKELGFVSPLRFIKIAEDSRLIIPIGKWVLEKACSFIKRLNEEEGSDYVVAVNISVIQLLQEDFVDTVLDILEKTGLQACYLELEITESILMNSVNSIIKKLELLKKSGIKVALDDFGTGYSSLSYLNQLPISVLKIDKAFISSISESKQNNLLTGSIIEMGHVMGIEVVAEGIENNIQLETLKELNCDKIQGYIISKPLPEEEVFNFLNFRRG
jgi:diguanylate cyclase (GGDEF)-like protein